MMKERKKKRENGRPFYEKGEKEKVTSRDIPVTPLQVHQENMGV